MVRSTVYGLKIRERHAVPRPQPAFREAHTKVPRPELAALATIDDPDQRLFLRFYLRSNIEKDLETAKARCEKYGIDYEAARAEARRS